MGVLNTAIVAAISAGIALLLGGIVYLIQLKPRLETFEARQIKHEAMWEAQTSINASLKESCSLNRQAIDNFSDLVKQRFDDVMDELKRARDRLDKFIDGQAATAKKLG